MLAQHYFNDRQKNGEVVKKRIAFVGTKTLNDIGRRVAEELDASLELTFIDSTFADAAAQVESLVRQQQIEGVISSGGNESYLTYALPQMPITHIPIDGFDLLSALAQAANTSDKIALLSYQNCVAKLFNPIRALLNRPLILRGFDDLESARTEIKRVSDEGCAIVGSSLIVDLAREAGVMAHHYYSERNVALALESAAWHPQQIHFLRPQPAFSEKLLERMIEPAILLDAQGELLALNQSAHRFGLDECGIDLNEKRHTAGFSPLVQALLRGKETPEHWVIGDRSIAVTPITLRRSNQEMALLVVLKALPHKKARSLFSPTKYCIQDFLGSSPAALQIKSLAQCYAKVDTTVLINGESGTGKELIAQGIHQLSARQNRPFIAVNTSAMQESLIESELFGYEDGTFTGSRKGGKTGLFEAANGGTLFLDEIGDMPLALQTRLLRVLQEKEISKLGSHQTIPVDVRIIAATNKNLRAEIEAGNFREDLFYRLNILTLQVPPLRERLADIPFIAERFLNKHGAMAGEKVCIQVHLEEILASFEHYSWPGNVRELQNIVERIRVYCQSQTEDSTPSPAILRSLCPELWHTEQASERLTPESLKEEQKAHEMQHIRKVLQECDNNISEAAKKLGVSRTTLWRKTKNAGAL